MHSDHLTSAVDFFFFFNDTATTEIYTLSLHDALPIWTAAAPRRVRRRKARRTSRSGSSAELDRKSTRLNSSHSQISYAVFCLKKKKIQAPHQQLIGKSYDRRRLWPGIGAALYLLVVGF